MKKVLLVLMVLSLVTRSVAQAPATYTSADIYLQVKKLNVLGSVLYVAAHPDDENTRLLAYFSKDKQYRTGYLSLTRGDGGQNLLGDEQGVELGLIRTQELLAARRIDGAEQFFSRAYDFGFSKNATEALRIWNHDKILSDVVWIIRKFQPDVIVTRFPPDARAGHGHHWASAILAREAFSEAADSTKFPEQFKYGVKPWQAKRLLWNTYQFGRINTTDATQYKMDIGMFNPLLGKSYGEIASESRSQHRSQGFGVPKQRGKAYEYFKLMAGDSVENNLMSGVDLSWNRIGAPQIGEMVTKIASEFNFEHPENSVNALVDLYKTIRQLPDGYWRDKKLQELQNIIVECCGIFAEAVSGDQYAVQGSSLKVDFFVNKRNNTDASLKEIRFPDFDSTLKEQLATDENYSFSREFEVPVNKPVSQPYWLERPLLGGSFDVTDQTLIGKPQNDPAYEATFVFTIGGVDFPVKKALQYKYTDPVKGEVYEPLPVVPAITGSLSQPVYLLDGQPQKKVQATIFARRNFSDVQLHLKASGNWKLDGGTLSGGIAAGDSKEVTATVSMGSSPDRIATLAVSNDRILDADGKLYTAPLLEERRISYEHIPDIIYFKPLTARLEKIDITLKGKNIGYIPGAGDKVPEALRQLGYQVTLLSGSDLTDEKLKPFDAVITGIRAYDLDAFLGAKYETLMSYIRNGGNLIVQYNRSDAINQGIIKVGPYHFNITTTRVTDETAKVDKLLPDNPVFNYPNKITDKDFDGWIQERSTYQAADFDSHFIAPIGMNDPGEKQSNGSLIIAKYGKGNFIYTGLVFFRQLPAGVPGAYRLMANLISLPQNH